METDFQARDDVYGSNLCRGYRSDLAQFHHRDMWAPVILQAGYTIGQQSLSLLRNQLEIKKGLFI